MSAEADATLEEDLRSTDPEPDSKNGQEHDDITTVAKGKNEVVTHTHTESISNPPQEALAQMSIGDMSSSSTNERTVVLGLRPELEMSKENGDNSVETDDLLFVVDTVGDNNLAASTSSIRQPVVPSRRTPSPVPSSSDEEVVFRGRQSKPRVIDESVLSTETLSNHVQPPNGMTSSDTALDEALNIAVEKTQENGGAAESIAALTAEVRQILKDKRLLRSKGRQDDTIPLAVAETKANRRGKRGRKKNNRVLRNSPWVDVDDDDVDDEAAYEDYMANLAAQMDADDIGLPSAFTRSELIGGASMMVDGREYGLDDVIDHVQVEKSEQTSVASDAITGSVDHDEGEDEDEDDEDDEDDDEVDAEFILSDLDSSDLEDELEYNEKEQWEDEEDIRLRRIAGMQDEQIARLLAKQQELGIEGDDLVIDDGYYAAEIDMVEGIGDIEAARAGLDSLAPSAFVTSSKRNTPKRRGKAGFSFPSASLLADTVEQYGEAGFDIMDLDRPSLRPRKKGRKGALPAEVAALSDDDLKQELASQWENDRARKRVKKLEREELRQQGLLGSAGRKGKPDLSQKYLEGLNMKQVMDEIRTFMQNDGMQSRPFPPMDTKDRKKLHEIASAFNLKSKSVGAGKNRFPVLYKSKYTVEYDEAHFQRVMLASSRGFLKVTGRGTKPAKKNRAGAGGGFDRSAVELRNGEVVGANAAEISHTSFGHKLMEKMGWTRGTALGKDGEGMLTPVAQVMRYGKAGLG